MNQVEQAEAHLRASRETLADLLTKRGEMDHRTVLLDDEQHRIAYSAHTGDAEAKAARMGAPTMASSPFLKSA
jgi:hypothetical protein